MRNITNKQIDRQTRIARVGSMTGFILSGCFAAWAIVESEKLIPLLAATLITFILGLILARRATKTLYGR